MEKFLILFMPWLPAILCIWHFNKGGDKFLPFKIFILFTAIIDTVLTVMALNKINNHVLAEIYSVLELPILALVLYKLSNSNKKKIIYSGVCVIYILYWITIKFFIGIENTLSSLVMVEGILLIGMTGVLLIKLIATEKPFLRIEFWIVFGLFFYYATTLILVGSLSIANRETYPDWFIRAFTYINITINIITYLIYSYAFLCLSKKKISNSF